MTYAYGCNGEVIEVTRNDQGCVCAYHWVDLHTGQTGKDSALFLSHDALRTTIDAWNRAGAGNFYYSVGG